MKVVGLILLVAGLWAIDESYLDGRNTTMTLDSFRASARVINRYVDDLLRPLRQQNATRPTSIPLADSLPSGLSGRHLPLRKST
jgi:hypothetical protein